MHTFKTNRVFAAALVAVITVVLGIGSRAEADKDQARVHYDAGQKAYNLGKWDEAIGEWEEGYRQFPSAIFLFNIAQAYRKKDDCEKSVFFYKRYLSEDPESPKRDEVLGHIADGERLCEERKRVRENPPDGPTPPDDVPPTGGGTTPGDDGTTGDDDVAQDDDDDDDDDDTSTTVTTTPSDQELLFSYAEVGPAFIGAGDVDVGTGFSILAGVAYPLDLGVVGVELGGALTVTPVSYEGGMDSSSAMLSSFLVNAAVTYPVITNLKLKGVVGAGILWLSGIEGSDNPFIAPGYRADGALPLPNVRVGLAAEYAIGTSGLVVSATPFAFSYSPAKDNMEESVSALTRVEITVGVGYRL